MAKRFITVSIEIMHDTNLNQSQKFILAEIEQLSQLDKGCIASNEHFSKLIGITKENVSRNINDLEKKGYIGIEIVKGTRNHTRIITLTNLVRPPYQNSKTPLSKQQETKENKVINITKNKEKNIKKEKSKPKIKKDLVVEILKEIDLALINKKALNEWLEFKNWNYKKVGITKLVNMLSKYNFDIQQEIVDKSIMNNYQGLFEPKNMNNQPQQFKTKEQERNDDIDEYFRMREKEGFKMPTFGNSNNLIDDVIDTEIL